MTGPWDVVVIGAGIVGLATARELQRRDPARRVLVVDRESRVAAHQSSHSSGVLHAGIYYPPGSLKARACVRGRELLERFCDEHAIAHERCGKLVVALDAGERTRLDELERRAIANGVPGLRRLEGPGAIAEVEPYATGVAALHSPMTGIVDFAAVAGVLAEQLREHGGELRLGFAVQRLDRSGGVVRVSGPAGTVQARRVVACAGLWSDRLAVADGAPADPRIVPFRGGYLRLRPSASGLVRGLIYPVPDPALPFLGVHLTRTIGGELWLGPTALLVGRRDGYRLRGAWRPGGGELRATLGWPGTGRVLARWWRTGAHELATALAPGRLVREAARYVPALGRDDVDHGPHPAGIRAQAVARDGALVDDFVVHETGSGVHVRNAPSPAATSSLALAELIADRVDAADR
ncbi:L-2-hydroxyglutarate oxidase [Patulibacter defluvii]|uniref:L-2-hydroxyglutarate oxidase n=1 Tax=Patulibacter defluvii TaxID=3095358 RepID=UPI002A75AABE|nr:L-2-hydroxyglutarate oxidase [Patulibacter sp. DM4]